MDIIEQLLRQPIVWLALVMWALSAVGGMMQKAARRAAAERTSERRSGGEPSARRASAGRDRPDPEEIAREIRRAMGLEPAEPKPPRPQPRPRTPGVGGAEAPRRVDYDEVARPAPRAFDDAPPRPTIVYDEAGPRRSLVQELAARDAARLEAERREAEHRASHVGEDMARRAVPLHVAAASRPVGVARRSRRAILDLSRPAAAFVAMEVFGPPVASRESWLPREV